ncbi:MAG: hypothetical protein IJ039_09945 [Clostridia bacterium]|nr:hypothetical protein [Clostridia bacterium]
MKICIVSRDKRYIRVNELLYEKGYDSALCAQDEIPHCDVLILSVRDELTDIELKNMFSHLSNKAVVLCGNAQRIKQFFGGNVIDYSLYESFLMKNAYLTAEAAVSYLHSLTQESINGKRIFISGYGRIGKALSKILAGLGADVCVYARRNETKMLVRTDGYLSVNLEDCINHQIIINTVPNIIFQNELIDRIPNDAYIIDLASSPYGFENMQRVHTASGLPGKVLSKSAAMAVFDTILSILSSTGKE